MSFTRTPARHNDGPLLQTLSNLLCFRHPFCAEEETLHHQQQKNDQMYLKIRFLLELLLQHESGALPYEAFTQCPT